MPKAAAPIRIALDLGEESARALLLRPDGQLRSAELRRPPGAPLSKFVQQALEKLLPPPPFSDGATARPAAIELLLCSRRPLAAAQQGVRIALLVTDGFQDLPQLFVASPLAAVADPATAPSLADLCPPERCLGVPERLGADGAVVTPLTSEALGALCQQIAALEVSAIAVVLLHSYQNDAHERTVAAALAPLGLPVSLSSVVSRVADERQRLLLTVLDAAFAARVAEDAAAALAAAGPRLLRLESTGGAVPMGYALPLRCGLSVVAAALCGARRLLGGSGVSRFLVVSVDDDLAYVALCEPPLPGQSQPLSPLTGLASELRLLGRGLPTVDTLQAAILAITVERGHDPADYPLVVLGSHGPSLASALAERLGTLPSALIRLPGPAWVAAYGALAAPLLAERSEPLLVEASTAQQTGQVAATLQGLSNRLRSDLRREGYLRSDYLPGQEWLAELRYAGQRSTLTLLGQGDGGPAASGATDLVVRFCAEHQRRYGFALAECPVELVALRSRVTLPLPLPLPTALSAIA